MNVAARPPLPFLSSRRARVVALVVIATAAVAALSVIRTARQPLGRAMVAVFAEDAAARARNHPCRPLVPRGSQKLLAAVWRADAALLAARKLPPGAALQAQLAVLRDGVEYPACRASYIDLANGLMIVRRAEPAIRATLAAPALTAADRAAARTALASIDRTAPTVERIMREELDVALGQLTPSMRGDLDEATARIHGHRLLGGRARWMRACPAGTALAACATALADEPDVHWGALMLRELVEQQATLDALDRTLAAS